MYICHVSRWFIIMSMPCEQVVHYVCHVSRRFIMRSAGGSYVMHHVNSKEYMSKRVHCVVAALCD